MRIASVTLDPALGRECPIAIDAAEDGTLVVRLSPKLTINEAQTFIQALEDANEEAVEDDGATS